MAQYDITIIVKDKTDSVKASKLIEAAGGKIVSAREIGQRQFAYPIGKLNEGYYASFVVEIEPSSLTGLQASITNSEDIIRALILQYQPTKPLALQRVQAAPAVELAPVKEQPKQVEVKPEPKLALTKAKPVKKAVKLLVKKPTKEAQQPSEAQRLKALDEQLKKLLGE